MAKGATIYRAELGIADMDRNYYGDHTLTLACHPSETEERLMVRLFAFAQFASEGLSFGGGVSTRDEPDLWDKDETGAVRRWIELGHPEERSLRRACGRAARVVVVCFGGRSSATWWKQNQAALGRLANLSVLFLPPEAVQGLGRLARRTMRLQCNIQDGVLSFLDDDGALEIQPQFWQKAESLA